MEHGQFRNIRSVPELLFTPCHDADPIRKPNLMIPHRPLAIGLTPLETRRNVVLHVADRAEELGYSALYVAEGWGHDVSVLLAEIALRTSRIRIGTGVLNVWGRSAASIAMLATSLSELSGGRFVLGLGAGSPQLAEGLHGVAFRSPVHRLEVVTREVRNLLDGGRLTSTIPGGSSPLKLAVRPTSDVPIQLAALGSNAVRLCGELADAWYPFLLPLSGLPDKIPLLKEGTARSRSSRSMPKIWPGIPAAISPDPKVARELAWWWITFYLTSMGPIYANLLRDLGFEDAVAAVLAGSKPLDAAGIPEFAEVLIDETQKPPGPAWIAGTRQAPRCRSSSSHRTAVSRNSTMPSRRCVRSESRIHRSTWTHGKRHGNGRRSAMLIRARVTSSPMESLPARPDALRPCTSGGRCERHHPAPCLPVRP
ncbi:LLM class flavin-dependent oxidoreductase [Pseudonocardia alaniniphila]|uniref:LLM class flavin-dependent oxidoreductase n=1 Tax=Pseudonocardia alaniniphila TaxID=75291 RepID=A0ABS9TP77_9PSEU|nr:LLM class flavin-dependent oxidoreductase [Pseudonocardia alaniniphila]MCH6170340.1 LLM class flavin-dependent oxidoreductase [Pseudonocardia alaniniphila]